MLTATHLKQTIQLSGHSQPITEIGTTGSDHRLSSSGLIASNKWTNQVVRFVYFLNIIIVLGGLGYIASHQKKGEYRCKKLMVSFDEEIWENAIVQLDDGSTNTEERLIVYSHFNGIYRGELL